MSHWNAAYESDAPWDIGRPQSAFVELADAGMLRGRVLDVGCGTGEHTLLAAAHGLAAVGVDVSDVAIERAREKARLRGQDVRFLVGSALDLAALGEAFDTVLDCGLFHVFDDRERALFVESLLTVLAPGGRYFMLCFSDRVPGEAGPRRITQAEIYASFAAPDWRVDEIVLRPLEITRSPEGVPGWRAAITRL